MRTKVNNTYSVEKIQNAINENEVIEFAKGTYKITKTLLIPSNRILLTDGAVLRRYCSKPVFQSKADKNTNGYLGAHDIKIIGGTIEGMNDCGYGASDMLLLFHTDNVAIIGVTFLDNAGSHAIDLGGCKNTHVLGCKFLGCKSVGKDFRETIQIDYAYHGGIPYYAEGSPCFDETHCDGVNIIGCEFGKSPSYKPQYVAIGTHTQTATDKYHKNIVIKGNKAVGNVDDCLADACRSEVLEVIKGNHTRSFILLDVVERTGGKGTPVEFHLGQTVHIAAILTDAISWEWVVLVAGVIIAPGICVVVSTVHLVDDETICRYYHHSGYSLDIVGIIVE